MAEEFIAALDEGGATKLVQDAQTQLGTLSDSGSDSLGPFVASWGASASFSGGSIDLIPSDTIRIDTMQMDFSLNFSFGIDLGDFLPEFCLPQICIPIPFDGSLCTPKICVEWPTISVPVSYSDSITFTADFELDIFLNSGNWNVDIVIQDVPFLQLSPIAAAILTTLGLVLGAVLAPIPFIGPFLAVLVPVLLATIGVAGMLGWLGAILTPFVSGLRFNLYKQPQLFNVLPAGGALDPAVNITLDLIEAEIMGSDEDELVISANVSPA